MMEEWYVEWFSAFSLQNPPLDTLHTEVYTSEHHIQTVGRLMSTQRQLIQFNYQSKISLDQSVQSLTHLMYKYFFQIV